MAAIVIPILLLVAFFGFLVYKIKISNTVDADQENEPEWGQGIGNAPRMRAGLRRRRGRGRNAADSDTDDDGAAALHIDDDEEDQAQPKAPNRRDAYEARRAAKDAERAAQEAAQEEEIRRAAEERARREAEEAERWMHMFTVEAAGEEALSKEQGEALLNRMVDYLQARKTVALEELAAEFNMKTAEAVSKVQSLETQGRITGVMDDRGKYIYVSREEMQAVADFIRQRGRIAIAELAAKSGTLIDLEGTNKSVGGNDEALMNELLAVAEK